MRSKLIYNELVRTNDSSSQQSVGVSLREEQSILFKNSQMGSFEVNFKKTIGSEKHLKALFNLFIDPVIVVDSHGYILEIANGIEIMSGFSRDELVGRNFNKSGVVTTDSEALFAQNLIRRMSGVEFPPYQVELMSKSGEIWPFEVDAIPIDYLGNTADLVIVRKLNEVENSGKVLAKSKQKYLSLFPQSDEVILIHDLDDHFIAVNQKAIELFGFTQEEFLSMKVSELKTEGTEEISEYVNHRIVDLGFANFEIDFKKKNNEIIKAEVSSLIFERCEKKLVQAVLHDITKSRKAEMLLKNSQNIMESILQNMPGGYMLIGEDYKIYQVNQKTCEISGYSEDELVGQLCDIVCPKGSASKKCPIWEDNLDSFYAMDTAIKCKDGRNNPVSKNAKRIVIDGKKYIIENFQDTYARKQSELIQGVIYHIAKAVNTTKNLEELYQTIQHLLGQVIDNSNFYIALYDKEKQLISYPYYVDEMDTSPDLLPQKLLNGLTEYVLRSGESLLAPKELYLKMANEGIVELFGAFCEVWVGIPLRIEDQIIGVMALQSYTDVAAYNEKDLEILELISYQIALAIENKNAEQINRRLSEIIRNASDGIVLTDPEGQITYLNPAFEKMSGYSLSELLHTDPAALIVTEDMAAIADEIRLPTRTFGEWKGEMYCRRKNNEVYPIESRVFAIKNAKNELIEIAAIQQDITERKRAEQIQQVVFNISNAANSADNLELLIRQIQVELGTIIDTTNFSVVLYEARTGNLTLPFYTDEKDIISAHPFDKKLINHVFNTRKALLADAKTILTLVSGEEIEPSVAAIKSWLGVPLKVEGEITGIIALHSYIDEQPYSESDLKMLEFVSDQISVSIHRKKAVIELITALEKATESDRLKTAFLQNMSHEIRTPMNGILGFTNLLKDPNLSGEQQQSYIDVILKSGDRMLNTLNDLMDISMLETGQMKLTIKEINVDDELANLFAFFKPEVEKKGMELHYLPPACAKAIVAKTDREKFCAILINLIKNAIKYSHHGQIEFGCEILPDQLKFYVKDTGIGIPVNRQHAIFDRFVQADIDDLKVYEGAGLGLSISKAYVEMLGGTIWVESLEKKGSQFYFTIPLQLDKDQVMSIPMDNSFQKTEQLAKGFKILIVEDDETAYEYLSIILEDISSEQLHAKTGREAVELCSANPEIDLVLMDIRMPVMGGYEATREIRQFNSEVVIIAQTAYAQKGDRQKALESGCNEYISKPIDRNQLLKLIDGFFNQ